MPWVLAPFFRSLIPDALSRLETEKCRHFLALRSDCVIWLTPAQYLTRKTQKAPLVFIYFLSGLLLVICASNILFGLFGFAITTDWEFHRKTRASKIATGRGLGSVPFPLMPIFHQPYNLWIWNIFPIALAFISYSACQEIKLLWWRDRNYSWEHRNV